MHVNMFLFFPQQAPVQARGRAEAQTEEEEGTWHRRVKEDKNNWSAEHLIFSMACENREVIVMYIVCDLLFMVIMSV